jgi:hypothetical protein
MLDDDSMSDDEDQLDVKEFFFDISFQFSLPFLNRFLIIPNVLHQFN